MEHQSTANLTWLTREKYSCLYHITDKANLSNIISCGGLCSWSYINEHGISVQSPNGDSVTHRLDARYGMDRMIHLYLTKPDKDLIESYVRSGRSSNAYILEIDIDVIKTGSFYTVGDPYDFADLAARNDIPTAYETQSSDIMLHIPDFIPLKYIRNMPDKYTASISSNQTTAVIFIIDQSISMSKSTVLNGVHYDYMSEAVAHIVNRQIESMLHSCIEEDGQVSRNFDIAVLGYGENTYSAWSGKLEGKGFVAPELLMDCGTDGDMYRWIEPYDSGTDNVADEAFQTAYILLEEWMSQQKNRYYYPPSVIHITDGGIPENRHKSLILSADALKRLNTADGNVLIWNFIITADRQSEFILPSGDELPAFRHGAGLILYEASSIIPEIISRKLATQMGKDPRLSRRAIGMNVSLDTLSKVLGQCIFPQ